MVSPRVGYSVPPRRTLSPPCSQITKVIFLSASKTSLSTRRIACIKMQVFLTRSYAGGIFLLLLLRQAPPPPVAPQPHRLPLQQLLVAPLVPHLLFLLPLPAVAQALFHQLRLAVFLRLLTLPRALSPDHLVILGHVSLVRVTQPSGRPSSRLLPRLFHHRLTALPRHLFEMVIIGALNVVKGVSPTFQASCVTSPLRTLAKSSTTPCARSLLPLSVSLALTHPAAGSAEQAFAIVIVVCRAQTCDHLVLEMSSQDQPALFPTALRLPLRKLRIPVLPPRVPPRRLVASFL